MLKFLKHHSFTIGLGLLLASQSSMATVNYIPSGFMLPTLQIGSTIVVNKHAFGWRVPFTNIKLIDGVSPQRGDIVTFAPLDSDLATWVKRVAAIEGDLVTVQGGALIVNGEVLSDVPGLQLPPTSFIVPRGQVFLAGDNAGNSADSRYWGTLPTSRLTARSR